MAPVAASSGSYSRDIPLEAYYNAKQFYTAGQRCLLNNEISQGLWVWPSRAGIVNLCLSCELFIKSLLLRTNTSRRVHNLETLFNFLLPVDQAAVKLVYEEKYAKYWNKFSGDIDVIKEYFEDLRYWYDDDSRKGRFGYDHNPAHRVADSLYDYCSTVFGKQRVVDEFPPLDYQSRSR